MDPKALAAINRLLNSMSPEQVFALADAIESLKLRQGGAHERGGGAGEQGSIVLTIKGGRVRFLEVRSSRDIGGLESEAPIVRTGRV